MFIAAYVRCLRVLAAVVSLVVLTGVALAQTAGVDHVEVDLIEKARARARQVEETKQVLGDPDQNVRLAAFEAMVGSDDLLLRELALDAGLASTDQLLRGLALRYTVLGLEQLNLTLAPDASAPKPVQERVQAYLEKTGRNFVLNIDPDRVDLPRGTFGAGSPSNSGNVSGTVVTFDYGYYTGELHLQDDNTLAGTVYYSYGGDHQFKASAPLR
jgi:hypothetical protein